MEYYVNENCIGCGLCVSTCPEVFSFTEDDMAKAMEGDVPENVRHSAEEAMDSCPTSAIELK